VRLWCKVVHNQFMAEGKTIHRQTVSLPAHTARRVKALARSKDISTSRLLCRLVEEGLEAEERQRAQFFELAKRFRSATEPEEAARLGDQLGRMVFGG